MALDGEPKDGDYVRYIDRLVNRGMPQPGQVIAQNAAGDAKGHEATLAPGEVARQAGRRPARGSGGASAKTSATTAATASATSSATASRRTYPAGSPARDPSPDNGQANAMRIGDGGSQAPSLAVRSAQRKISTVIFVVALLIAWHAVRLIAGAIHGGNVDVAALMPGAFLLVFALMVFAMSRNIRRNADRPAGRLPPLTTVSGGKAGRQGNPPR